MVKFAEVMEEASQAIGAKRVFGEPYEKNGVTVIPAARVMGGVGGGEGDSGAPEVGGTETGTPTTGRPNGIGGGYGLMARPAGAFVIKGNDVKWLPAIDVNRIVFGMQLVMVVFFLTIRSIAKARAKK